MKLKVLIFPIILVASLYLVIWVIVPEYKKTESLKKNLADLEKKLENISIKEKNAASLAESLNSNSEDQKLILKYLPSKKQDEYLVASINSLAFSSGVAISRFNFSEDMSPANINSVYDEKGRKVASNESAIKGFTADMEIIGNYDKIRQFIFSLSTINRLNEFKTLSLAKASSESADILVAKIGLTFKYFEKMEKIDKLDDKFFASGEFDMDVAQDIRKKAVIDVPKIDIGAAGRSNLFAL